MNFDILTFTPYLGDTFLSSAVARKIHKVNGGKPCLFALNSEMSQIIGGDWMNYAYLGEAHSEFIKEGSLWNERANIKKERKAGHWEYKYSPTMGYEAHITKLCSQILREFEGKTVYTLHNTYPHALLGRMARKMGYEVRGYFLSSDNRLYYESPNGIGLASIWTDEFIGDRICRMATGRELSKEDFDCSHLPLETDYNTVTLFPTTRGQNHTAGHWDIDVMYLKELGYNVRVAVHTTEKKYFKDPLVSQVTFTDIQSLVKLITSSEFIICNDSIAFHLAWHYNKKAMVKMKAGFNREWQPRWTRDNPMYQFIPPSSYFEEEYLELIRKPILELGN